MLSLVSSVNSQLSKEINFEIVFRNLKRSILRNFAEAISLMELSDWIDWSVDDVGFRKFISSVKVLSLLSKEKFLNKFLMWKWPKPNPNSAEKIKRV